MSADPHAILRIAQEYVAGGLSVLPIRPDGTKAPALDTWDHLKIRLPLETELHSMFSRNGVGIGIIGGTVSGNLGMLDFEYPDFAASWCELVEAECPGLVACLPQVLTPGKSGQPGKHFYYRSREPVQTTKLARLSKEEALARTGDAGKTTAIEVKGEGGYCLAPGCPAYCHESGRLYAHVGGPFIEETPVLEAEQVEVLLQCARALNRAFPAKTEQYIGEDREPCSQERPGDVFNRRADWLDVLLPHGWSLAKQSGPVLYLRRPGKDKGISATAGHCQSERACDLLCVFSTNAEPLGIPDGKDHQCYSKFAAYALLNHNGDFRAAARDVAAQGYGFDIGLSSAERFASEKAMEIEDIQNESAWDELRKAVARRSAERAWDLSGSEIDLVVKGAKEARVRGDPKLLAEEAHQGIDTSLGKPDSQDPKDWPEWKLIIVESFPPKYYLRAPYWSRQPKVIGGGGFILLKPKEILSWPGLREPAMTQADARLPDKIQGWPRLLQRLLDSAEHRPSALETVQSFIIRTFIWEALRTAREIKRDDDGQLHFGMGSPLLLADGRIIVKLNWLLKRSATDGSQYSQQELVHEMEAIGMAARQFGTKAKRARWWFIDPAQFDSLQKASISAPLDPICDDESTPEATH